MTTPAANRRTRAARLKGALCAPEPRASIAKIEPFIVVPISPSGPTSRMTVGLGPPPNQTSPLASGPPRPGVSPPGTGAQLTLWNRFVPQTSRSPANCLHAT